MNKNGLPFKRVDFQVSILTAIMVLFTSLCVFFLYHTVTYKDTIRSLSDRVNAIYNYLENNLDADTFKEIETKEDMNKESYKKMKSLLEQIKEITDVMYLYTARMDDSGKLIYIIDGLDEAEDFRYPGDEIEIEIQPELKRALSGETILPNKIATTEWGKIFITYLPFYYNDEIVGAVGIEFEAEHQYNTYLILKILTPIICIMFCLLAVVISMYAFRRISNPNYRDIFNTDLVTQLKNRNAFEVDIRNMFSRKNLKNIAIISVDLNNLKVVNDTFDHSAGDRYIQLVAKTLEDFRNENMICYRIGGDEFAVIVSDADDRVILEFIKNVQDSVVERKSVIGTDISVSVGYSLYNKNEDNNLFDTYKRADKSMYENKKIMKKSYKSAAQN